jgi:amidase
MNRQHERMGAIKYGQANLDISDEIDLEADRAKYEADRARTSHWLPRTESMRS